VEALREGNVRCAFGLPGTQTLELFEALRRSGLRTVVATNELSAAFMAGGWARVTGQPGVVLTIPGPGFTWALTGIAEARLDSVPLLQISGAPAVHSKRPRFRQQEIDQAAIGGPLFKAVINADLYSDPGVAALNALRLARSGEPGPVLLHVSSMMLSRDHGGVEAELVPTTAGQATTTVDRGVLESVCASLRRAQRPVLMVGQGTNRHAERVRALVEQINAPLLTTPSARGLLPENHRLNFGFDPLAGDIRELNKLIASSDLVLVIGCKLSHGGTSGFDLDLPPDRLVHVDASSDVVGANYPASLGVVADAGELLRTLLASSPRPASWTDEELETWRARVRRRIPRAHEPSVAGTPTGDACGFFEALRQALPADSIVVLDSGLHQILARRYYTVLAPCGLIMPSDLQSMGFAIPTAIGVRIAEPHRPVIAIVGDGGFAMTVMELLTAVRERIPLTVIVFVDGSFGQIRLQQLAKYGVAHGVALERLDLRLLAESIGARHVLMGENDAEGIFRAVIGRSGVSIIEVRVGDTPEIRRAAAYARAHEITRRLTGPRFFGSIKKLFRKSR
jgi:acetolactate synthase I/II/III large subunit